MKKVMVPALIVLSTISVVAVVYFLRNSDSSTSALEIGSSSDVVGLPTKEKLSGAELAQKWRSLAWKDSNGNIPVNGISQGIAQRDSYLAQQRVNERYPAGVIANFVWESRGPENVGGRTRSIVIHPTQTNIMWAAAAGGGVWKSTDGGDTWTAPHSTMMNYAIGALTLDPNNADVLYAGTGEGPLHGGGIYKSENGGLSWRLLEGTIPQSNETVSRINRIAVAPGNSNLILVATRGGIFRSVTAGEGSVSSWNPVMAGGNRYVSLHVSFDPQNASKAMAEIMDYEFSPANSWYHKAIYSTDGGVTWNDSTRDSSGFRIYEAYTRIDFSYSKTEPNIVYAINPLPCATNPADARISRSTDGGQTFSSRATTMINPRACPPNPHIPGSDHEISASDYHTALWVSPSDSNFVLAGGYSLHKSTDGGNTVAQITDGYITTVQPHVDFHCVVPDPGFNGTTNKAVYVCTDGGIYRTNDITTANKFGSGGWQRKDFNYQTAQYYGASGISSGLIYGGTQDNATLRTPSASQTATWTYGGDGGYAAVDPTDSNYCYGEHIFLSLHRTSNCNATNPSTQLINSGITDVGAGRANFIAPFILDPNDSQQIFAGASSLWRSGNVRNSVPTWSKMKENLDTDIRITAIAVAQGNSNIAWTSEQLISGDDSLREGRLYKTTNGLNTSPTWTTIDDNVNVNPLPNRFITRILVDRFDSTKVYVTFGGFTDGNLWKTSDGGTTWQDITGPGLPNVPIRGITQHPSDANKLYLGTEIGVYTTTNGGSTWSPVLDGPSNVSVDEITFMNGNNTLLAATHGRGVWTTNTDVTVVNNTAPYDFDGDNKTDLSIFRPTPAEWWYARSIDGGSRAFQFGLSTDTLVPGDFSGDGKADVAIWRPSNGNWYVLRSEDITFFAFPFGTNGDVPAPADFDGDGKFDAAVFRPSTATWYISNSSDTSTIIRQFGLSTDRPVPADFDADGHADLAIFRPCVSEWWVLQAMGTEQENLLAFQFGTSGDKTVQGDYTGDGKADAAIFRPSNGYWYIQRSNDFSYYSVPFGTTGDIPAPGDYDGDGKFDTAVFRPSTVTWYAQRSTAGTLIQQFGQSTDTPVPNAYVR